MPASCSRSAMHRVLGIVLAPAVVGELVERLQRVVVALGEAGMDQALRCPARIRGADIGRLQDRPQIAVAIGWARTNSVAEHVQQKYSDQGLSTAVSRITRPMLRARSAVARAESRETHRPHLGERFHEVAMVLIESMSVRWSRPTCRRDARKQQVSARAELLGDPDPFAPEIADRSDRLVREQLVASGVHACERRERLAHVQTRNDPGCGPGTRNRPRRGRLLGIHVANVRDPSAHSNSSAICPGPRQIVKPRCNRRVVVSGSASSASDVDRRPCHNK